VHVSILINGWPVKDRPFFDVLSTEQVEKFHAVRLEKAYLLVESVLPSDSFFVKVIL